MLKFFKTTVLGGLIFMIPIIIMIMIFSKAYEVMEKMAKPLGNLIPLEQVGGIAIANIVTIAAIILFCFFAGLAANSRFGQKIFTAIDDKLLIIIPGYAYIKSITEGVAGVTDDAKGLKPVLVRLDDQMQIAFEVERQSDDVVVVYFPGAPDPRSGAIAFVTADRISKVDKDFISVINSLKRFGQGSGKYVSQQQIDKALSQME
ncbi:DUF502 domain-containing protein [Thalassotalea crassostreae]|uniref:DUF502 domain-containing protein n=1 Tax=Thalassotalea crassostreae TaxID=1763536 RepID=UPI0008398E25|nr:DUF502 domain-containing protein [Thalassotalea crassostreae]